MDPTYQPSTATLRAGRLGRLQQNLGLRSPICRWGHGALLTFLGIDVSFCCRTCVLKKITKFRWAIPSS